MDQNDVLNDEDLCVNCCCTCAHCVEGDLCVDSANGCGYCGCAPAEDDDLVDVDSYSIGYHTGHSIALNQAIEALQRADLRPCHPESPTPERILAYSAALHGIYPCPRCDTLVDAVIRLENLREVAARAATSTLHPASAIPILENLNSELAEREVTSGDAG